jgi:hypothetical protein
MSKYVTSGSSVVFTPAAQTLNFAEFPGFNLSNLLSVVDLTAGTIIYAAGVPGLGFASVDISGTIVTLAYNTNSTAFASADRLQIYMDGGQDSLIPLVSQAAGLPDPTGIAPMPTAQPGLLVRPWSTDELMKMLLTETAATNFILLAGFNLLGQINIDDIRSTVRNDLSI